MGMKQVYVGLGGNIGDTVSVFYSALERIGAIEGIQGLDVSPFYRTTPVGSIPQDDFVNAVCTFMTSLDVKAIHRKLKKIERELGKVPKEREAPRVIDLDLLFFGDDEYKDETLEVPHPRWSERMFVVKPLSDLVTELSIPGNQKLNLKQMLETFPNIHNETVTPLSE